MAAAPSGQAGDGLTERDRQREDTRRRIREVALGIIRRDGLEDARVDEIARSVGVSRGSVYFHYPTKEHVVAEVLAEAEGRIAAALRDLPKGASLQAVLEGFCSAFAQEWEKEAPLFPSVAAVAVRNAAGAPRRKELDAVHAALTARLKACAEKGELTPSVRPVVLANVFLMSVTTTTLAWSSRPRPRLTTALADAVGIFLDGARSRKR